MIDGPGGSSVSDAEDLARLKAAAAGMDDLLEMALPDAPGMSFVGGRFSVATRAGAPVAFSCGAADESRQRAFRRCVAEMVETRAQFAGCPVRAFDDRPVGFSAGALSDDEGALIDAMLGDVSARSVPWVEATRLVDGMATAIPAPLCLRDLAGAPSVATSLGCAAGRSLDDATWSALRELVERDAIALWWRGGACARKVDAREIPEASALVETARADAASRSTRFLDVTTDTGLPVVVALSWRADGHDLAFGFAASSSLDAAACSAFRELAQMELGNRLVSMKAERAGEDALALGERRQLDRMRFLHADDPALVGTGAERARLEFRDGDCTGLARHLAELGISVHLVALTSPGEGIPVVKAVAPLLQAEPGEWVTPRLRRARETGVFRSDGVPTITLI